MGYVTSIWRGESTRRFVHLGDAEFESSTINIVNLLEDDKASETPLVWDLECYTSLECSDDRDLLFSLVSLQRSLEIPVDNGLSYETVCKHFSIRLLRSAYAPWILWQAALRSDGSQRSRLWPSWVVDLKTIRAESILPIWNIARPLLRKEMAVFDNDRMRYYVHFIAVLNKKTTDDYPRTRDFFTDGIYADHLKMCIDAQKSGRQSVETHWKEMLDVRSNLSETNALPFDLNSWTHKLEELGHIARPGRVRAWTRPGDIICV